MKFCMIYAALPFLSCRVALKSFSASYEFMVLKENSFKDVASGRAQVSQAVFGHARDLAGSRLGYPLLARASSVREKCLQVPMGPNPTPGSGLSRTLGKFGSVKI